MGQSLGWGLRFWYGYGLIVCDLFLFVFWCFMGTGMGSFMFSKCMGEECVYVYSLCVWFVILLGFHLFVGWYLVLVLLIIFGFILCVIRFFMRSVLVVILWLGRVCVMFLDCLDVRGGYVLSLGMYVIIVRGF